jgi:predicted nucleic acid-binding protein
MLYVDSSAFSKRFLQDEELHDECVEIMAAADEWATSRLTLVETPRALHQTTTPFTARQLTNVFDTEVLDSLLVDIDRMTLAMARDVAIQTGIKSLDAIHLASALRVADGALSVLTYDKQQTAAAAQLGLRLARQD